MYTPELVQPVDLAISAMLDTDGAEPMRLPISDIRELNEQLNVNLTDTDSGSDGDCESWFDSDTPPVGMSVISAEEFFERYV